MSIFPTTDIVSDVAEKADARRLSAGLQRLREGAASGAAATPLASGAIQGAGAGVGATTRAGFAASLRQYGSSMVTSRVVNHDPKPPAMIAAEKFEAFVLQTWLETLLPKTEGGSFGTDGSANVWRSMMAEQLGMQLARSGGVGLQKILASHPVSGELHAPEMQAMNVKDGHLRPESETKMSNTAGIS
jgi:Rod binding domain-containing protein